MTAPSPDHARLLGWIDQQLPAAQEQLIALARINSGSFHAEGVAQTARACEQLFAPLGAKAEWLSVAPHRALDDQGQRIECPLGPALRLRQRPDAPLQIFLCGHLDTVFPADSPFQQVRQTGSDRLNGPGVADLKGGLVALSLALRALEQSPERHRIGYTVLLNPDEEIGSIGSAPLLKQAAGEHHFGLIYEPALPDGSLASTRKGSGNFDLVVRGRAAHAGRDFDKGRNAIVAAAQLVQQLDALNGQREGVTINPGYIHGGGALNVVPDLAIAKFNVRTQQGADEGWMQDALDLLTTRLNAREGLSCELVGGFTRPPKVMSKGLQTLMDLVQDSGRALALDLRFAATGGCCDGNNLAAHGLPNLDNMGVVGGELHSDREWMRLSSLTERAKLTALLLLRLASGERQWL